MATPSPAPSAPPRVAPPGGIDPAITKPKGVREAAAKADELFKAAQQANGNAPADPAPDAKPNGADTIVISDAPINPPKEPVAPPAQQAAPTPTPTPPAQTPPADDGMVPRNEFNAMKGRFDQAQKNNVRLSEEITNLRTLITQLSSQPAPAPAATPPELQAQSLLTPQEIQDYGADFLDVVGKKAREIAGAEIAGLKKQIEELTNGVRATAQVSAQTARDNLFAKLTEEVPDWQTLNTQPEFLAWLGLPDVFSGAIRSELLRQAFDQNNTARVIAFFKGFLTEEAATTPVNPTPPTVDPTKVPLESFAAPGRAKSAAAPAAPAEKPIISRTQVTQFYLDVAAGKYKGREEEKIRLENMIFAATNEGRLR
jgi:hypothetical protein